MKRVWLPLVASGFLAMSLHAMEDTMLSSVTGTGTSSRPVEYMSMTFMVSSICQPDPSAANEATTGAGARIQNLLLGLIKERSPINDVFLSTTSVDRYSREVRLSNGEYTTVCDDTWQSTLNITFKSNDLANWNQNVARILTNVAKEFKKAKDGDAVPVTQVTWTSAIGNVCAKTLKEMNTEAVKMAALDAKSDFLSVCEGCEIPAQGAKYVKFEEVDTPSYYSRNEYARSAPMNDGSGDAMLMTNVEDKTMTKTYRFYYRLPGDVTVTK